MAFGVRRLAFGLCRVLCVVWRCGRRGSRPRPLRAEALEELRDRRDVLWVARDSPQPREGVQQRLLGELKVELALGRAA